MQVRELIIMRIFLLGTVIFLFLTSFSSALLINEVMYNPEQCSDALCEWVEIYNPSNHTVNIDNCTLLEKPLEGNILANDYFIFLRNYENFSYYYTNRSGYQESTFSLTNSGKEIVLAGSNFCNDTYDYTEEASLGLADGNGKTLERREDGTWQESLLFGGSPGQENSIYNISVDIDPQGEEDNENGEEASEEECLWTLDILNEDTLVNEDFELTLFLQKQAGNSETFTVKGEIKDFEEQIIKEYSPWTEKSVTRQATKHYSPNLSPGVYTAFFWSEEISCEHERLETEKTFIINIEEFFAGKNETNVACEIEIVEQSCEEKIQSESFILENFTSKPLFEAKVPSTQILENEGYIAYRGPGEKSKNMAPLLFALSFSFLLLFLYKEKNHYENKEKKSLKTRSPRQ